ncbi:MAG: hypothetical protein QOE79_472 [Sphingomonadales bacterium]|nr:hypothetical protein [Sphingomonadales bacterium]
MRAADKFVEHVSKIRLPDVFNPWGEVCRVADRPDAAVVRTSNLRLALHRALEINVDSILVGRDLGYRGGRRTGLALTDEAHLSAFSEMYGGISLRRATKGPIVSERTAAMFWDIVVHLGEPVFTWNVFPFHPYISGECMSNRCHTRAEREECRSVLMQLLDLLRPSRVIAIGNDAETGLADLGIPAAKVRHPSYGGKSDFVAGIRALHPGLGTPAAPPEAQPGLF